MKFKTFQFATVVVIFILLGFPNKSDARAIISIGPTNGSYHAVISNQIIYHTARVKTDEPFYCVWWYVDDEYVGYSDGSNVKTVAYFSPTYLSGHITGIDHKITAEVGFLEDNGDSLILEAEYILKVFEPKIEYSPEPNTDVWGYREITKHYRDGFNIIPEFAAYAYNPLHEDEVGRFLAVRSGWIDFYHEVTGDGLDKSDSDRSPAGEIPQRGIYGTYYSSLPISIKDGKRNRRYKSIATVMVNMMGNAPHQFNITASLTTSNEEWFWRVDDFEE